MMTKRFLNIAIVLFTLLAQTYASRSAAPASPDSLSEDTIATPDKKYSYVVMLDGDEPFEITDSLFYSISRKVIFPVNKYVIPENSEFRKEIEQELMPYMNDRFHQLEHILVRGAASPEGPRRWNETLSIRRAQALTDLLQQNAVAAPPVDSTSSLSARRVPKVHRVAEDYVYLLLLMKERGDKDYEVVADIVNRWIGKDEVKLKDELRRYDHSKLWLRLLREYFPELRAARVVLVFKKFLHIPAAKVEAPVETMQVVDEQPEVAPAIRLRRREMLSVKTNLLLDFAYMPGYNRWCPIPNIAVEYYPLHGHFTFGASVDFPWWQHYNDHKFFQLRNYQFEARYYLKSGDVREVGYGQMAYKGWYLQAHANVALYGISFAAKRGWEGEGFGGGVGIGYVLPLGKDSRWRLEFSAQVGYFWTKYDPYQYESPVDNTLKDDLYYYKWEGRADLFKKRQYRFDWLGPTRLGVTLSYDLLFRKRVQNGVSLNRSEMLK